jgi:hypothetical protein
MGLCVKLETAFEMHFRVPTGSARVPESQQDRVEIIWAENAPGRKLDAWCVAPRIPFAKSFRPELVLNV